MRRALAGLSVVLAALTFAVPQAVRAQNTTRRVIVSLRAPQAQTARAVASSVRAGNLEDVREFDTLPYFAATVDAAALSELARSPWVSGIVDDVPRPLLLSQSGPLVEAPMAWDAGYTGAGWTVAVLDTGVDAAHPFLSGKVASEACYSTTDTSGTTTSSSLCPGGLSSATSVGSAGPCSVPACDHGTHVAGIAAGSGASFGGIARDARVISIQVFSRFTGAQCGGAAACVLAWDSDVIAGLDRVYALRNTLQIAAVNLSLGSSSGFAGACDTVSPPMKAAIDQLRSAGIATVVAAGNSGATSALSFPACISTTVSVGSTTKSDVVSTFSDTSSTLSLLAPGEPITSSVPGGSFASKMGTSMAAPHVTGAWALLRQRKPEATIDELVNALRSTGKPVVDTRSGSGLTFRRIRVKAAIDALLVSQPAMSLDSPGNGTLPQPFSVSGWAVDRAATSGSGVDAVHVWAYPSDGRPAVFVGAAAVGARRDDVGAAFGAQFANAGYGLNVSGLSPGGYTLQVAVHSTISGTFNQSRFVNVTIPTSWPEMNLDGPGNGSSVASPFTISGWALDRMASSGTGVDAIHVWAFPADGSAARFLGQAGYGNSRTDVGAAFGSQFNNSGYLLNVSSLPPGVYDVGVYAHSAVTGTFNQVRFARVTVGP